MSYFSFSYEKKGNIYFLSAMLRKQGIKIRITADGHGWIVSYIPPSNGFVHPLMDDIQDCLLQYALYEICQNKELKEELFQRTSIPRCYKNIIENAFEKPYIWSSTLDIEAFNEDHSILTLTFVVYHAFVSEKVNVIFNVTNAGYEPIKVIRTKELKTLEKEGFPFHPLSDEQILTAMNEHEKLHQEILDYVAFSQHILAIKQCSCIHSFTITYYKKENEYQDFELQMHDSPLFFHTEFTNNKLTNISINIRIKERHFSYSFDESSFTTLYTEIREFITKKSKYRVKFLF